MYRLIKEHDPSNPHDESDIEMTINGSDHTVDEMLEYFGDFLRGCGYVIGELLHEDKKDTPSDC